MRIVSERGRMVVNLGDQLVLKSYRWLLPGVHPELEVSRFLTETAKFTHVTQLAGTVEYSESEGRRSTLAILESYGKNQGSAWAYTLSYLERFLDECLAQPENPPGARHVAYRWLVKTLGRRTAEFHQALALPDAAGAFGSEPITEGDIVGWVNNVRARMDAMYELLKVELPQLPDAMQPTGNSLIAAGPRLYRRIMRAETTHPAAAKARCHGDYHLGQAWLSNNDFLITNYGGEPGRPWAERREKHTPLRDIAGMLFSFSEVADAAMGHIYATAAFTEAGAALRQHIEGWQALAIRDFFRSYRRAMKGHSLFPSDARAANAFVTLFLIEKATASLSSALRQRSKSAGPAMQLLIQLSQFTQRKI